jgi:hypothetical protein
LQEGCIAWYPTLFFLEEYKRKLHEFSPISSFKPVGLHVMGAGGHDYLPLYTINSVVVSGALRIVHFDPVLSIDLFEKVSLSGEIEFNVVKFSED